MRVLSESLAAGTLLLGFLAALYWALVGAVADTLTSRLSALVSPFFRDRNSCREYCPAGVANQPRKLSNANKRGCPIREWNNAPYTTVTPDTGCTKTSKIASKIALALKLQQNKRFYFFGVAHTGQYTEQVGQWSWPWPMKPVCADTRFYSPPPWTLFQQ